MKIIQPQGPYSLIGHSYGGVVAYEMARILLEEEAAAVTLTLLDSRAPAIMRERLSADELESLIEACSTLATLQGITLSLDARQLAALPREARYGYIASLLAAHDFAVDEYQLASFASMFAAQTRCYRRYEPRPLSAAIDVYLYRAILDQQHDHVTWNDYGWNQLLSEPLRVVDLEAGHYSMLESGCVEQLATQLREREM
jgi:thioesterase domain-containing protein